MPPPPDRLDRVRWRLGLLLLGSICIALGMWTCTLAWGEHTNATEWMRHYKSANQQNCCGLRDCRHAAIAILALEADTAFVTVDGVPLRLPRASLHHSEDAFAWWCAWDTSLPPTETVTRCVFYNEGI